MDLYHASVPVFLRYLDRLRALVDAAEAHDPSSLLQARLAPDMHPFEMQVRIAANFALRTCFPLAGLPIPPYGEHAASFDGLRAGIAHVVGLLRSLEPSAFADAPSRIVESQAGNALVRLVAPDFLLQYALPNFFFHLGMAYAILRSRGVGVGKEDFDGLHAYRTRP